ncbi:type II secretion system F family protein [Sphaerisporangium sp. NPDC049003]|uniref:type II secretion system F family protein n=1 Tax=Sphaerisporangium sp. NPDC049003 TaxID=3364517 RepID=UPI00372261F1
MTEKALLTALIGVVAGIGILVVASGLKRREVEAKRRFRASPQTLVRLAACVGVAILAGAITRWPVGAALSGLATWFLPKLLGPDREHTRTVARIEAIAAWTEMLRDILAASAGLHQAISATAPIAPEAIRPQVAELAARVDQGERLSSALKQLSDELADPTGDLVCAALILAAKRQAGQLGELLGTLASAARAQAVMRLRVAAARAQTRSSVRTIVAATVAMVGGLMLFNRHFLVPYDTALGQVVLLAAGLIFAGSFFMLHRLSQVGEPARILTTLHGGDD